ncbi:MAG: Tol-Pal system beta propeller repeat protein TolB [Deferrisomatales bacterium]
MAVACALPAQAKVYIDINAPTLRRIPLAAPTLRHEGGDVGEALTEIPRVLRANLTSTELFEVLDPRGYLEDPQAPLQPTPAAYADWFAIGAEVLVKGRIFRSGEALSVELWAHDVLRRQTLFGRQYSAPLGAARTVAHMFANTVLEEFTGSPGPFGTQIAYVVQQGQGKELAVADMDGAAARRLTNMGSLTLNPAWSRDGRYLYYTGYQQGDPDLYLLDLTTSRHWAVSQRRGLDLGGRDSPDGKELLLVLSEEGNPEIYRMNKATREVVRLTRDRAIDVAPTWSPDGKRIAFVSDRLGNPHIFTMDRDGRDVRRLTVAGTHNGDPDWSPRGDWIAFTGKDERGAFQVYMVDPQGRQVRQLTFGPYDTLDPTWSPDGRFLAVTSAREGDSAVYVFRVGGQEFRRVSPRGEKASQPAWSPVFFRPGGG